MRISIGIKVTKANAKCVLSNSKKTKRICQLMMVISLTKGSEVLELYNQGKSTCDIAKILRMSLRDISLILKNGGVNHGMELH